MPVFSLSDPDFFDQITTPGMEWVRTGAREVGWDAAAVASGDVEDGSTPVMIVARIPPGGNMTRHAHDAYRIEIQLFGSQEHGEQVLLPGDISVSAPGEFYGPNVAGPEGSVTIEFISSIDGIVTLLAEQDDPEQVARVAEARERVERHRAAAKSPHV